MAFLKNISVVSLSLAVAGVFAFFYTLLLARMLGIEDYGLFQALIGIYSITAGLSFPLTPIAIHGLGRCDADEKKFITGEFIKLSVYLGLISAVILSALTPWLNRAMDAHSLMPFAAIILMIPATALIRALYGALQGWGRFSAYAIARSAQSLLTLVLGALFVLLGWGSAGALAGYFWPMAILCLVILLQRDFFCWHRGFPLIRSEIPSLLKITAIFLVLFFLDSAPMILARIMISPEECGLFAALYNLRNTVWPLAYGIVFTYYAHSLSEKPEAGLTRKTVMLTALSGGVFIAAGFFRPAWLFGILYGKSFEAASAHMALYGISITLQMLLMVFFFWQMGRGVLRFRIVLLPPLILAVSLAVLGRTLQGLILSQVIAALGYFLVAGPGGTLKKNKT